MNIDALVCDRCGSEACWNGDLVCDAPSSGVTSRRAWLLSTCPAHAVGVAAAVRNNRRILGLPPQDCTCAEARRSVCDAPVPDIGLADTVSTQPCCKPTGHELPHGNAAGVTWNAEYVGYPT